MNGVHAEMVLAAVDWDIIVRRLKAAACGAAEEIRVRWFMMDAQQRQAVLVASLTVGLALLDSLGSRAGVRAGGRWSR